MKTQLQKQVFQKIACALLLFITGSASYAQFSLGSPNGGENWTVGSNHNISWTNLSAFGNDSLFYSIDSAATWITIGPGSAPSYSWTIPNTPSTKCFVKAKAGPNVDISASTFTITGTSGINETTLDNGFNLFPVPAHDQLTIFNGTHDQMQEAGIYNSLGSLVARYSREELSASVVTLDISTLPKGVYMITLDTGKYITNKKMIVW